MSETNPAEQPARNLARRPIRPAQLVSASAAIFAGISEEQWRTARACYYGRLSELDEQFGLLIDYLEASGQLENTVVIATADHGKYVGSHGMDGHNFGPFEEVYNIPLLVAGPGIAQRVETPARVGLHAVGPTILEWANADPLPSVDAVSFAELCAEPTRSEDYTEGFAENHGNRFALSQRILWDDEWKLAFNGFDFDELYNLERDPNETRNRATDPECAQVLRALTAKMWGYIRDGGDQSLFNSHYYTMRTGRGAQRGKETAIYDLAYPQAGSGGMCW